MGLGTISNANDNSQGLRMALMTAGTENGLREQEQTRQMGILTGADAGLREAIKTGGGVMGTAFWISAARHASKAWRVCDAANRESEMEAANKSLKTARKGQTLSTIGTGASMGAVLGMAGSLVALWAHWQVLGLGFWQTACFKGHDERIGIGGRFLAGFNTMDRYQRGQKEDERMERSMACVMPCGRTSRSGRKRMTLGMRTKPNITEVAIRLTTTDGT